MFERITVIVTVLLALTFVAGGQTLSKLQSGINCPNGVSQQDWRTAIAEAHGSLEREHLLLSAVMAKPNISRLVRQDVRQKLAAIPGRVPIVQFLMVVHVAINDADLVAKLLAKQMSWDQLMKSLVASNYCACIVVVDKECCAGAGTCIWRNGQCFCNNP